MLLDTPPQTHQNANTNDCICIFSGVKMVRMEKDNTNTKTYMEAIRYIVGFGLIAIMLACIWSIASSVINDDSNDPKEDE